MPVMAIEAINLEEELAIIKVTPERISKENVKKDAEIKHQNEHTLT